MKTFKVFVPVVVKPKQSGVITRIKGKASMRKDPDVWDNSTDMSVHILRAMDGYDKEYSGPIAAFLVFWYPTYKGPSGDTSFLKSTQPDIDNLQKQVFDVLQRCQALRNDGQVAIVFALKARTTGPVGVSINLCEATDGKVVGELFNSMMGDIVGQVI